MMLRTITVGASILVSATASAGPVMSGAIWGGGNPGPSDNRLSAISATGGSGGGTTGGGLGRASLGVQLLEVEGGFQIRVSGDGKHVNDNVGSTTAFTSDAFGSFEGIVLALDQPASFSISASGSAVTWSGQWVYDLVFARLIPIAGTMTGDETSGELTIGTYSLEAWVGGFGSGGSAPRFTGANQYFDGIESSGFTWTLNLMTIPAPGALAICGLGGPLAGSRRRNRG